MIIIDRKIPLQAKETLSEIDSLLEIETSGIVYEAISGHPDIFFTKIGDQLIVSPSLPEKYLLEMDKAGIKYIIGEEFLGDKYPATVKYNCVEGDNFLIHNFRYTDASITRICEDHDLIQVDQGYTRCNLIALGANKFITSDKGIEKTLLRYELKVFYQNPDNIVLPGHKYGFIGGCAGIKENQIFFIGKLEFLSEGEEFRHFIEDAGLTIVELCDGPLFDGGSLIFT